MTGVLRPVTEITISSAFLFGVLLALLGSLKLTLSRSPELNQRRAASLFSLGNIALIAMMPLAGVLIDSIGVQPVLIFSSAATAVSLFALGYRPAIPRGLAAVLLGGLGSAGLCAASIVLMPEAFLWHNPSASLNAGFVFFACGALVTPSLVDVLTRLIGYRRGMALLALACLVPGVVAALTNGDDLRVGAAEAMELAHLWSERPLWFAALVFALYAPLEASITVWATAYFTDHGSDERRVTRVLTGFWGAFLSSRLFVAAVLLANFFRAEMDAWILVLAALLTAVAIGNLAGAVGSRQAGRGLLFVGFCLGPIAPTLVGMVFNRVNPALYGMSVGILFAAGSFGSLAIAPVIAWTARAKANPQSALFVPLFGALLVTAATLVFALIK
jgi:fucose permease